MEPAHADLGLRRQGGSRVGGDVPAMRLVIFKVAQFLDAHLRRFRRQPAGRGELFASSWDMASCTPAGTMTAAGVAVLTDAKPAFSQHADLLLQRSEPGGLVLKGFRQFLLAIGKPRCWKSPLSKAALGAQFQLPGGRRRRIDGRPRAGPVNPAPKRTHAAIIVHPFMTDPHKRRGLGRGFSQKSRIQIPLTSF